MGELDNLGETILQMPSIEVNNASWSIGRVIGE